MSSGVFSDAKYSDDQDRVYACRVQGETLTAWNGTAAGAVSVKGRIKVSAGRREAGLSPRTVSGKWVITPAGYAPGGTVKLIVFTKAAFDAIALNDVLAYNGATFKVTGKNPEKEN